MVLPARTPTLLLYAGVAVLTVGCASPPQPTANSGPDDPLVASGVDREATPAAFSVCHGYGCASLHMIGLNDREAAELRALFEPSAPSAAEERKRVAQAVALLEQAAARRLGTDADLPRTPYSMGDPAQLDCVDESINTSTFLHLLDSQGWLRWHRVGDPAERFRFMRFGRHYTAVLIETGPGDANRRYAVDSWFHANGVPAEVVALPVWRAGWDPD
jgi:hypothetical protein